MKCRIAMLLILAVSATARAQEPVHYDHAGILAPGAIGMQQLQRGGPLPGYFQPIEVRAPEGSQFSVAVNDHFVAARNTPVKTALLVGLVYRFRVTGIPKHEGEELYPTVEIINRLYPPVGEELKFPVPIELTQEDLDSALEGRFITRIVYVENPRQAYPRSEDPNAQECFEVNAKTDPLAAADRLGRPIAIVRIGGRTPEDTSNPGGKFMYNSPPLLMPLALMPEIEQEAKRKTDRQAHATPRPIYGVQR